MVDFTFRECCILFDMLEHELDRVVKIRDRLKPGDHGFRSMLEKHTVLSSLLTKLDNQISEMDTLEGGDQ